MDTQAFEAELRQNGYGDIVHKDGAPSGTSEPHHHDFAVRGMVLAGEFILNKEGVPTSYFSGQTFEMNPKCSHFEAFGPEGSRYIIGRKHD
jgi:hypothetical protein